MQPEPTPFVPGKATRVEQLRGSIVNAANCNAPLSSSYLVKGWLGSAGISMVYGESNVGKSFFALDLALHVAAGEPWHGNRVRQGRVLYIASEGGQSIMTRLEAVKRECPELHAKAAPNIDLVPLQVDLHAAGDADAIIEAAPGDYRFVIIDTLAQSFGGGNENEGRDMNAVISNIMRLKVRFDCQVLLVHHSGKDAERGARGHSSLRAAVDTEIQLKRDGDVRVASATKQRDMMTDGKVAYILKPVMLGVDDDGDPVTSCVVLPSGVPAKTKKPLTGFNEIAFQGLCHVLQEQGRRIKGSEHYPGNRRVVEISAWRAKLIETEMDGGQPDAAFTKRLQRARGALKGGDYIREHNGMVWLVGNEEDIWDT